MTNKKISVIIPIYNCEKYIDRCIRSILRQSYPAYEILLVNDGSTDASGELCDNIALKENSVKVIHQTNRGVSSARNTGLEHATGDYISFIDADDEIPENSFFYLINAFTSDYDLVCGSCLILGANVTPVYMHGTKKEYTPTNLAIDILSVRPTRLMMSGVWGKLFSSRIINDYQLRFDEHFQNGEDGLFISEYLRHTNQIRNIKEYPPVYYLYRYDGEERQSAVSAFYPDFFEFHILHSHKLHELISNPSSNKDISLFYNAFIDELIVYLVRAYAYKEFFKDEVAFNQKLKQVIQHPLVNQGIKFYKRKHISHSIMIPFALRIRSFLVLKHSLPYRAKLYLQRNIKSTNCKSIYRKHLS